MKRLLIVDDHSDARNVFRRDLEFLSGNSVHVDAPEASDGGALFEDLEARLGVQQYDGTILDVIYDQEVRGGIELWRRLERNGLAARCGKILVVSNNARDQDVQDFAAEIAEGRICGELGSERLRRIRVQELLDVI